ncbi:MAG: diversity-generating retroelement protein Avd [Planctomycetia bacterium]|nr:diversity-generating retroelement protein Avd [Planctomycetia bacterium]
MKADELQVIERAYELVVWLSSHLENFPKSYKFTLAERMGTRLYEVLELLIEAKYSRERQPLLKRVNLHLEVLRFQSRIAKDTRCWSIDNYGSAARKIDEVGKLVGGWLRRTNSSEGAANEAIRQPVERIDQFPAPAAVRSKGASPKAKPKECGDLPF